MLTKGTSSTEEKPRLMPMIDVAFLILIFFMALPLKSLDGKIEAFLPKEGFNPWDRDDEPLSKVRIRIRRSGEETIYRIGSRRFSSHYDLIPLLEDLGKKNVYEIDGAPGLPNQAVMNVVDLLNGLRYDVHFRGGIELTPAVRRMYLLPKLD